MFVLLLLSMFIIYFTDCYYYSSAFMGVSVLVFVSFTSFNVCCLKSNRNCQLLLSYRVVYCLCSLIRIPLMEFKLNFCAIATFQYIHADSNCDSSDFVFKHFSFPSAFANQTMKTHAHHPEWSSKVNSIANYYKSNAKGSRIHSQSHFTSKSNSANQVN